METCKPEWILVVFEGNLSEIFSIGTESIDTAGAVDVWEPIMYW